MLEKCTRCGADKVMDVELCTNPSDFASLPLVASVERDPAALLFKGSVVGALRGRVCGGCGHTEIYTTDFEKVYEAYQRSQGG
jgi:hypothetical protein